MPRRGAGRPFALHTKLGRLLEERGLGVMEFCIGANTYPRAVTEYLAGRRRPSTKTMIRFTDYLRVPPDRIYEDEYPWTVEKQRLKEEKAVADKAAKDALAEHRRKNNIADPRAMYIQSTDMKVG